MANIPATSVNDHGHICRKPVFPHPLHVVNSPPRVLPFTYIVTVSVLGSCRMAAFGQSPQTPAHYMPSLDQYGANFPDNSLDLDSCDFTVVF